VMNTLSMIPVILMTASPIHFQRHEIDAFPAGYQVAVADLNGDGRPDVVALSTEASRVDWYENPTWKRRPIARAERPIDLAIHDLDGDGRPESEIVPGRFGPGRPFLVSIEPWHGHQVVVYTADAGGGPWHRRVLDETLAEGHALVVADFDGDGQDEIVAGWRAAGGGLTLYDPADAEGRSFRNVPLDRGIAVEGLVAVDLNGDGRLDLLAIAGRTNNLVWYENRPPAAKSR